MSEKIKLVTKPRFKQYLLDLESAAAKAGAAGNYELQARILLKLADIALSVSPEIDARVTLPKRNGKSKKAETEKAAKVEEPPPVPQEDPARLRGLSDEELERSLGR